MHIDDLHFGPFPLRTTKKGISSNSPKKGQLFSLHQAAGYVTIKKAAFQPTSVCRKNGSEQKILLLMPGQFTGLSGEMKSSVLSYYGATLHTRTPREGPRALLPFFWKGDFALCGGRPRALPWTRSRGAPLENPNPWQHQEPVSDAVGVQICADGYPSD